MKIDKLIRRVIPSTSRLTYNPVFKTLVNSFDILPKLMYEEFSRIPPNHMRVRIGVGNRIFANQIFYLNEAKDFWIHAFDSGICRLDSTIVDIGCGCGRFAHHLRDYQFKSERFSGKYIGIDIDREMLNWCRRNFDRPRFEFHLSDHASKAYNTNGNTNGNSHSNYTLPVASESVDFVFSTSLFTHLLEKELVNYCQESYRLLKSDRFMAMSCFSLDHPPPTFGDRHTFRFEIGNAHVESMSVPEAAVAYKEDFLFEVAHQAGYRSAEMLVGDEDWHPVLLCRK